jgi:hypothetical protein
MLASLSQFLTRLDQFLIANASAIQTVAIVIGLGYVIWQTRQINRQLKLDNITNGSAYFKEFNELLLNNDRAQALRHSNLQVSLGNVLIGIFKARFLLHRARLTDKATWEADVTTMINNFRECEWLRDVWVKDKSEYPRRFQEFIDNEILPRAQPSVRVPVATVDA